MKVTLSFTQVIKNAFLSLTIPQFPLVLMYSLILSSSQHHHLFRLSHVLHWILASEDFSAPRIWSTDYQKGHPHQKCAYDPGAQPGQGEKQAVPAVDTVVRAGEGWPLASASTHPVLDNISQLLTDPTSISRLRLWFCSPWHMELGELTSREPKQPARVDTAKQRKQCKLPHWPGLSCVPKVTRLKLQPTRAYVLETGPCRR